MSAAVGVPAATAAPADGRRTGWAGVLGLLRATGAGRHDLGRRDRGRDSAGDHRPLDRALQPGPAEPEPGLGRARSAGTCSASTSRAATCCPGCWRARSPRCSARSPSSSARWCSARCSRSSPPGAGASTDTVDLLRPRHPVRLPRHPARRARCGGVRRRPDRRRDRAGHRLHAVRGPGAARRCAARNAASPTSPPSRCRVPAAPSICLRHIVPNMLPLIVAQATILFGWAMVDLAAISFLGLGVQPPAPNWGVMISENQPASCRATRCPRWPRASASSAWSSRSTCSASGCSSRPRRCGDEHGQRAERDAARCRCRA